MSRGRSYAYAAHTSPPPPPPVPPCYYYDDMEGYIGDYSESDGLSDVPTHVVTGTPPDVTEIYRRKTVTPTIPATVTTPTAQVDYHTVYAPHEYYYEAGTTPQVSVPRRATVAYRKRIPIMGERPRYYSPDSGELYDSMAFRSTHQILPSMARNIPPRVPSASAVRQASVRRHPITVRTPRFYRRPGGTTLYKKPSALCLPVACQPDPAVYKRSKRSSSDQIYTPEYAYQPQTTKVPYPTEKGKNVPQKVPRDVSNNDYNDLNVTKSKLDAALQRYEQIFEKNSSDADRYPEMKVPQILKSKIPPVVKGSQPEQEKPPQQVKQPVDKNKSRNKNSPRIDWSKARVLEVEGAESDALEKILLADLKANGMVESDDLVETKRERKSPSPARSEKKVEKTTRCVEANAQANEINLKDLPKSFNYQDIQNVVVKTMQHQQNQQTQQQAELKKFQTIQTEVIPNNIPSSKKCSRTNLTQEQSTPMSDSTYSRPVSPPASSQVSSKRQASNENLDKASECKSVRAGVVPRVLVDDAMELHRTKSYVVNLIDHALSNHFGTNLCEKYSTKDNPLDHKVAMELLKKHSTCKVNKDVCLEIAQALAETFNNSTSSCSTMTQPEAKQETSTCSCSKTAKQIGEGLLKAFLCVVGTPDFYKPLKKHKIQTFQHSTVKVPAVQCKKTFQKGQEFLQKILAAKEMGRYIKYDDIFKFELTAYPMALAPNGVISTPSNKSDLGTIIESFTSCKKDIPIGDHKTCHIFDGMALVQSLGKPAVAKSFGDDSNIIQAIVFKNPYNADRIDCVFDNYKELSIKGRTREKRGLKDTIERNIDSVVTLLPQQWNSFIPSTFNKGQLTNFLGQQLYENSLNLKFKFVTSGGFQNILEYKTNYNLIENLLESTQEEADTRIILHILSAKKEGYTRCIVDCKDTDVLVLLAHFRHVLTPEIWMKVGVQENQRFIAVHDLQIGTSMTTCLPAFHVLTGCDTTSQFTGLGKKTCWKTFVSNYTLLLQLGIEKELSEGTFNDIVKFVIRLYSTNDNVSSINSLRGILAASRPINKLPPTLDSLRQHCLRVHYQTKIWLNSAVPQQETILPDYKQSGWKIDEGRLVAVLSTQPIFPEDTSILSTCSCKKVEEPLYVKQLKQLRWGHLKHIQREVRRLEDLERFLDSCTSNTFS